MSTISIAHARAHLGDVIGRVRHARERVVLTSHGKPAAVVVSVEDLEALEHLEDAADVRYARKVLADFDAGRVKGIPHDEVWRRIEAKHRRKAKPKTKK